MDKTRNESQGRDKHQKTAGGRGGEAESRPGPVKLPGPEL